MKKRNHLPDEVVLRKDSIHAEEGDFECSERILTVKRQGTLPLHTHAVLEIFFFLAGRGAQYFLNRTYDLVPGDIFICPPHLPHFAYAIGTEPARYGVVLFKASVVTVADAAENYLSPFRITDPEFDPHIPAASAKAPSIKEILKVLLTTDPSRRLYRRALLLEVLALINEWYESGHAGNQHRAPRHEILNVLLFLQQNFTRRIIIEEMASVSGLSRSRFEYLFHATMGCGPIEHLSRIRLLRAKSLLLDNVSITDAAFQVGIEDSSRFSKMFRRMEGVSPIEWRRRAGNR
jgi:AraC-like DNA-binding protein/quercetin dioxygenase-like cupin family protein